MEYKLEQYLLGYTPILHQKRGIEIETFLKSLDYCPRFIILDDDSDMEDLMEYLIQVDSSIGLSQNDYNESIKRLFFIDRH